MVAQSSPYMLSVSRPFSSRRLAFFLVSLAVAILFSATALPELFSAAEQTAFAEYCLGEACPA